MQPQDQERFSRQIRFAELGEDGQSRLLRARVAVVGCGALGSFQAGALARTGVRRLRLIDRDYLEISNLQRQWLYEEADAAEGLPKAIAAARRLRAIDSPSRRSRSSPT
jgi:adenylyltransferase/sulfurtransferase